MDKANTASSFYSGMSGLALPIPKYKFPPEFEDASRLTYYASHFNSIEINRSFYALPNGKTLLKWTNQVPACFTFTFKLWKQITHNKGLNFQEDDVASFMTAIDNIGSKRACILIQFPPSLKIDSMPSLERLLASIDQHNFQSSWNVAIEFRDSSWYTDEAYELAKTFGASIVIHDKARVFAPYDIPQGKVVYVRFHGPEGNYRGSYEDDFLREYATYINDWLTEGKTVYVYFNNTMGQAFDNLTTLNRFVKEY